MRLDISVHYPLGVTVIQRLQQSALCDQNFETRKKEEDQAGSENPTEFVWRTQYY